MHSGQPQPDTNPNCSWSNSNADKHAGTANTNQYTGTTNTNQYAGSRQ